MRRSPLFLLLLGAIAVNVAAQQFDTATYARAVRPVELSILFSRQLIPDAQVALFQKLEREMDRGLIDRYYTLSSGSGFFISEEGHLITNYHVVDLNAVGSNLVKIMNSFLQSVNQRYGHLFTKAEFSAFSDTVQKLFTEGAVKRLVVLPDGKEYELKLLASDRDRDLALLQLAEPRRTERVRFVRARDLGEVRTVYSVGYPLPGQMKTYFRGAAPTISSGIISAMRERLLQSSSDRRIKTIQHTASLSPGNSGGPLVTETGLVVGVNSSLLTDANNIYFAISEEEIASWLSENGMSDLLQFRSYVAGAAGAGTPVRVEVAFTSAPSEAEVYVDDELIGTTPITTKLVGPREYDVRVRKDVYVQINKSVLVVDEEGLSFDFALTAGAEVVFDEELPSTIRVRAQKGEEARIFECHEPVFLPNGRWAISFEGPISNGSSKEVAIEGRSVHLSAQAFVSSMRLHLLNLLPASEILLRSSLEPFSAAANAVELPYGAAELLVRTPTYRDNVLAIVPDNTNSSFDLSINYQKSNAFLSSRGLRIGLPFLIGGMLLAGASWALNTDAVAAGIAGSYEAYAALKYVTFGTFVAGGAASLFGLVGTIRAVGVRKRSDEPIVTEYDFSRSSAGD